ncbi:hypothetical protein M1843_09920 [Isoptericola sp. 4D.3]|uniref:Uncharacterized protein n=1 Tax=Isoptericola peretonis TaxID=2918523 RepID=A0ABT0J3H4_9MICO|nr:hypothetical protein [Isoptericola sp. 4D.3]
MDSSPPDTGSTSSRRTDGAPAVRNAATVGSTGPCPASSAGSSDRPRSVSTGAEPGHAVAGRVDVHAALRRGPLVAERERLGVRAVPGAPQAGTELGEGRRRRPGQSLGLHGGARLGVGQVGEHVGHHGRVAGADPAAAELGEGGSAGRGESERRLDDVVRLLLAHVQRGRDVRHERPTRQLVPPVGTGPQHPELLACQQIGLAADGRAARPFHGEELLALQRVDAFLESRHVVEGGRDVVHRRRADR